MARDSLLVSQPVHAEKLPHNEYITKEILRGEGAGERIIR
jgi:hypothetical protein